MARPILVDTTRLLTRLGHPAPTGIDRVDLAYARQYLGRQAPEAGSENHAVALTSFGARLMPSRPLGRLFASIEARWSDGSESTDPVLARLAPRLGLEVGRSPRLTRQRRTDLPLLDLLRRARGAGWQPAEAAARDAVYLHTSHLRLDRPALFEWLGRRPDIRPVFFVHDLIPIEFPEYGVPGEDARHRTRLATVARHAAAIVVSCPDVARRLAAYLDGVGLRVPPVTIAPIGVEPIFTPSSAPLVEPTKPFFVVCSTIEARKNHLTLLLAWRDIAERLGSETPTLVLVGRRGWESENVIDLLERSPAIREHVVEAPGLSNAGLVRLMASARAVLMPSFAEGYGIPVVEALAVGAPVIASDLPAHREIAGPHATYINPLDGLGWRDAILAASRHPVKRPEIAPFQAPRWDMHFAIVDNLLRSL